MTHQAVLEFDYADGERADRVARSVGVETGDIEGDRTAASVARDGRTVLLTVEAADLVALRAGINTWTGLVGVAERCDGAVERETGTV